MVLRAGDLNKRIVLQTTTRTTDGGGGFTEVWADTVTVWANVEPLNGAERFEAQQVAASLSHRVTIRHRTVTPQQRVKYGTRIFRIQAVVNPHEGREMLQLLCEEEDI